jgi:ATP-dependent Clp protease ATP-binding subunit ClpC
MNGYNFTNRVRRALAMAREEAHRLRHAYVGTEHILLGVLRVGEGVASTVLENLKLDGDLIRQRIEEAVSPGSGAPVTGQEIPYTGRAKKVLELAMSEARELRHPYVGTEHVLLGLLREEKGLAAQVLVAAGLTLDAARAETVRLLGTAPIEMPSDAEAQPRPVVDGGSTRGGVLRRVVRELEHDDGWILRRELPTVREATIFLQTYQHSR